jgi:hypothetical protein
VSTVDIPGQAMDVAWRTFSESLAEAGSHLDYVEALADAITAAAPLIVATELRRQADIQQEIVGSYTTQAFRRVAVTAVHRLRDRADKLDPSGGAS